MNGFQMFSIAARKLLFPVVSIFIVVPQFALAQAGKHADCSKLKWIDSLSTRIETVGGNGNQLEISGNELGNNMYFTEEHNTAWIGFVIPYDGEMTFDIIPDNPADDWDFMLFKLGPMDCTSIETRQVPPVRSNLARNDPATKGVTGLSRKAQNAYEAAGVHPNFSKFLEVTEKERYILIVDINENSGKGFNLKINIEAFVPEAEIPIEEPAPSSGGFEFVDMTEPVDSKKKVKVKFDILNETTKKPLACDIEVIGTDWVDTTLKFTNKSEVEVEVPADSWFYVNVKKEGHTFSSEKYKASPELIATPQKIYISEVKQGSRIVLTEIVFRENTTHLLPTSVNALEQLIEFMKKYPTAVVEIQGHVNAPGLDNDGKVKKFSLKRAEQIKIYLTDAGIDGNRIKVKGMGNEHMIYPNPKTYDQEKANRRVEIEILSY